MGKELVDSVLNDFETAAIDDRLRGMLRFLQKMTLTPADLSPEDGEALRRAGVSQAAAIDATGVALSFNLIDRLADSFSFAVPPESAFAGMAGKMANRGYRM